MLLLVYEYLLNNFATTYYFLFDSACFYIGAFPILASECTQIRQVSLSKKYSALIEKLTNKSKESYQVYYSEFVSLSSKLHEICLSIEAYAQYWNPFLCVLFPYFISMQCYLAYAAFFLKTKNFFERSLLLHGMIESVMVLFIIINRCAQVVRLNGRLEGQCKAYIMQQMAVFAGTIHLRDLIKADNVQSNSLKKYSFKVFANYRIGPKTFYIVLYQISAVFLAIQRR
mgnify:CR=1 FL=1